MSCLRKTVHKVLSEVSVLGRRSVYLAHDAQVFRKSGSTALAPCKQVSTVTEQNRDVWEARWKASQGDQQYRTFATGNIDNNNIFNDAKVTADATKQTVKGATDATAETAGQIATPQGAGTMYGALAALHGAAAAAHVLAPQWASEFIFAGPAEPYDLGHSPLHRMLGTGHLAAAWSMWILKGAADKEELHKKEYGRLNLGAATFAALTLGVHAVHWDLLNPSAALTAGAIAGITAVAPAFYYSRTSGHGLRPGPMFQSIFKDLGNLMNIRGMKSAAYSVLTLGILGAGASYLALPHETLTGVLPHATSPACIMLWRSIGAGLFVLPPWTYSLKEASDAGVVHKLPFLDMNVGLATAGLAHLIVLGPWWLQGNAGPLMPYILGTWATALAVGTWGALMKRPVKQPQPI